jgi:glycosyltransferase involved in cell wall biosynthesis
MDNIKMKAEPFINSDNNTIPAEQPFFSIIIATYNRASLLKRALDSLIVQTERDWEAIIVDDESTDDTHAQVLPYLQSNHKIRYLTKVHSGEAMSKNAGINSSTGKFISFLDSDDEYSPTHLKSRKDILTKDPSIRFLHGGTTIIGNQFVPDRFNPEKIINLNACVIGGTFFIERELLLQLSGFKNILLGTDSDLYDRAINAGIAISETNLPTYIYHHENEDSITNKITGNKPGFVYR